MTRREVGTLGRKNLELTVVRRGDKLMNLVVEADPDDADELRTLLLDAIRRDGWSDDRINEFELQIRYAGDRSVLKTFVTAVR
ncbi:hypothetical protein [Fodinicola feengrottensis]|uniref:hypothetical protein n=1 Tax=Fodinicola feengrottensis TaxID=435914 RepID=UPI0031D91AA5